jgi:hypothetical protein
VNRAPVLTLWAAVVAERLGHDRDAALTLGKAVAGMNAVSKGRRLGVLHEPERSEEEERERARERKKAGVTFVELLGRRVPVVRTDDGLRAARETTPENPALVARYLESKLGPSLPAVRAAMTRLAASLPRAELAKRAYALYESFRPEVPAGEKGWGAKGILDLGRLEELARPRRSARSKPRSI